MICREKVDLWGRITNCHQGEHCRLRRTKVTASATSPASNPVGARWGSGTHREMTMWRWPNQKKRALAHKRHSRLLAVIETCDHSCINLCLHLCHHPSFPAGGFCVCFAASALFRRMKVRRTLWATPEPRVLLSIKLTHTRDPLFHPGLVYSLQTFAHTHTCLH